VTVERLEVHAIGLDPSQPTSHIRDHQHTAEDLVRQILASGGGAVLPWGVGKWLGARGREVIRLSTSPEFAEHPRCFLSDSAARCWPWPTPAAFRGHLRLLRGTDVLPLPGSERDLATYGFRVFGRFDADSPTRSLFDLLQGAHGIEPVGKRQSTLPAIIDQVRYRLRSRRSDPCL
jgi:hypothetical protein